MGETYAWHFIMSFQSVQNFSQYQIWFSIHPIISSYEVWQFLSYEYIIDRLCNVWDQSGFLSDNSFNIFPFSGETISIENLWKFRVDQQYLTVWEWSLSSIFCTIDGVVNSDIIIWMNLST